ncbi:MAG TPA: tetratricopeptide repeat protein, partial [Vicinamibacteria bacterium]|nr:tetratricopeptide repeat protein [Vicinamibacteria bacterium]
EADALGRATVTVELATEETGPALVSAPARLSEAAHGQRSAQALLPLSLVPPGRYVARAVVSLAGQPLGQVTRPMVVAPSRSAGLAAGPSLSMPAPPYDRSLLLSPAVLADALNALASAAPPSSPAVARALEAARQGHLDRLGDLLRGGETASAGLAFLRGLGLYASGDMTAAADQFRAALRLVPDLVPATVYLGAASAAIGRDQDAIGAWNTALLEDAHSPALSLLFADALLRTGEVDGAIDALREAAAAWPADDRFRNRLGLAYAASGRRAEAMPLLAAYVEAHPADVEASFAVLRLLYEAHPAGEERDQFLRYARAYVAAAGPRQALVAQWIKAVDAPAR